MDKKVIISCAVVALLMLVGFQTIFINIVKSEIQQHTGDAYAGDLWVDQLNIDDAGFEFGYIALGHVNATDDWVLWTSGSGNVKANWSVNISQSSHPEYFVRFGLTVYNVERDNSTATNTTELGNTSVLETYSANNQHTDSGTLSVFVSFDRYYREEYNETSMICYLQAWVTINDTEDATNFTVCADDRSVMGVSFETGSSEQPFARFVDLANDNFPNMFSWINGWNESSRFEDEDDMLNTQTFFEIGSDNSQYQPQSNDPWYLGTWSVYYDNLRGKRLPIYTVNQTEKDWEEDDGMVYGEVYMNYSITGTPHSGDWLRFMFRIRDDSFGVGGFYWIERFRKRWEYGDDNSDYLGGLITIDDYDEDGEIPINGYSWVYGFLYFWPHWLTGDNYKINIVGSGGNSAGGSGNVEAYTWEENCVYENNSYQASVSSSKSGGITTVVANLYDILTTGSEERVYVFSGDSGDIRVNLICDD
jgi:hypothetical protein